MRGLSERYQRSQIKAAVSVNREMLLFHWSLGRDIVEMHAESRWGSGFFKELDHDLQREIPNAKGFSPNNLRYMKHFYELFPASNPILRKLRENRKSFSGMKFSHKLWENFPALLPAILCLKPMRRSSLFLEGTSD